MGSELKKELDENVVETELAEVDQNQEVNETETDAEPELDEEGNEIVKESVPVEPWLITGDEEPVSVKAHVKLKRKLGGLLEEKDTENTELKARVKALESGQQTHAPTSTLKRPSSIDFDEGEDDPNYIKALEGYEDARYNERETNRQQTRIVQARKETLQASVDEHLDRADVFIAENNIDADRYTAAETKVRNSFEKLAARNGVPGKGSELVDMNIESIGKGSEKLIYYLANNEAELDKAILMLDDDKSGRKLSVFLGGLKNKFENFKSKKQKTNARKPAAQATGGDSIKVDASEKVLRSKYEAFHKKGDDGSAWDVKQAARKAGFDVSKWASG
jgi:hypothetical protein